jgi:hypothetical protein
MRNRIVFRLVGASAMLVAGLALSVLLAGQSPAFASRGAAPTPGPAAPAFNQQYCEFYMSALAKQLNATVPDLAKANKSALLATVDKALADRAITQTQASRMQDKIKGLSDSDPCGDLARAAKAHEQMHQAMASARTAIVAAVADSLKLPAATLEKDLSAGLTVPAIASSQNVPLNQVNAAYLAAVKAQLNAAVANKTITQPQADKVYAKVAQAVAHGKYPLLDTHMRG